LPGITGLAQISGRNNIEWDKRLEIDAEYVEKANFWLDLKILMKTVVITLSSAGVSVDSNQVEGAVKRYPFQQSIGLF